MKWKYSLFNRLKYIENSSFLKFERGDSLSKCYMMVYLASFFKLKNYVEIGVYNGRTLFYVAQAFKDNGGKAYGIDPFFFVEDKGYHLEKMLNKREINLLKLISEVLYNQVLTKIEELELSKVVEIIRNSSIEAVPYFKTIEIDMLHIDGKHDCESVQADIDNYTPLIREGGIIVFDGINQDSLRNCYDQIKNDYIILFETNNFGILMKKQKNLDNVVDMPKKLKNLYSRLLEMEDKTEKEKIRVNVGILAYNHEKYIEECLNSVIRQKGDFDLNIIICEDKSTDGTAVVLDNYIKYVPVGKNITFEYLKSEKNLGMVKNLKRLLKACSNSKYTALMDADDYWDDENKLQTHIEFMESHPECSISFDDIKMKNEKEYDFYNIQQQIKGDTFSTPDITSINFIGNLSCCFYYSKYFEQIPDGFFEMFSGDWMLNIVSSMVGEIGHIKKPMTIYRKDNGGIWNGMNEDAKNRRTIELIEIYNKFLNYTYDKQFSNIRKFCELGLGNSYLEPLLYRTISLE